MALKNIGATIPPCTEWCCRKGGANDRDEVENQHFKLILDAAGQSPFYEVMGRTPCDLVTGRVLKTPLDIMRPNLTSTATLRQLKQKLPTNAGCQLAPLCKDGAPAFEKYFRSGFP